MRNYELTFIVASDVDEQEFNGVLTQVQKWVEDSPGKVTKVDQWGRRRLAYTINDYNEGYYVTLVLEMNPQSTVELERNLKLSEKVIRHLLIRTDTQD
jgi:small subunit ribosomal protein S6